MAAPSPAPAPDGLVIEAVDWLPSGGRSGLLRVRGRWTGGGPAASPPELEVDLDGALHSHSSLPDPRAGRDGGRWRGAYVVRSELVAAGTRLRLLWPDGRRAEVPSPVAHKPVRRRLDVPPAPDAEPRGGEVVDRAVLAERRARRAEAAQEAQARIAREAMHAVRALEAHALELEERLAASPGPDAPALRARVQDLSAEVERLRAAPAEAAATIRRLEAALAAALAALAGLDRELAQARAGLRDAALRRMADGLRIAALAAARAADRAETDRLRSELSAAEARSGTLSARVAEQERLRALADARAHTEAAERRAAELAWASLADELAELRIAAAEAAHPAAEPLAPAPPSRAEDPPPPVPVPAGLGDLARRLAAPAPAFRAPGAARVVADLDAAARALRSRAAGPPPLPLREALAALAAEDPAAAAELLAGLLPAQAIPVRGPLEWDLTIAGLGTFACSVGDGAATVRRVPRQRREAAVRVRADALTLAELLAGGGPRIRRLRGPARFSGRRRGLARLEPLRAGGMSLEEAVRAGARLDPVAALRCLAHAVPAAWTAGHRFTVAHFVVDPDGAERSVHLIARDGEGLSASVETADREPDATVRMGEGAFRSLLLGEVPEPGERPVVRGDHRAVECLRGWADRVRTGA